MRGLRPFFTLYGGKWRSALRYPAPQYGTIVEPFAGSAGYSLRYYDRSVILVERDPVIAGTWRYLLRVKSEEIRRLPMLEFGQSLDDFPGLPQEAQWLIGWWLNKGSAQPKRTLSPWLAARPKSCWGPEIRERIASQVESIRHWHIWESDYESAANSDCTWFVDPPYEGSGKHYRHGSKQLDYERLAGWCRWRRGQVIVCEQKGATWLPFRHLHIAKANESARGGKVSREVVWEG